MITITVIIGNSDNNLTQTDWSLFASKTEEKIQLFANNVYFAGCPSSKSPYQNFAIVFSLNDDRQQVLKEMLIDLRETYCQDSIAWISGESQFI